MEAPTTLRRGIGYSRVIQAIRSGPLGGRWLFVWVFLAQLGHLSEHIAKAIQGQGLLGRNFDSELSHLLFNGLIAIVSLVLVAVYPRNFWVYPLAVLSVFHGLEHVYIFQEFMKSGVSNGPGLLGRGGAVGLIPLDRLDLHNVYNGLELILMTLGLRHEIEIQLVAGVLDRELRPHASTNGVRTPRSRGGGGGHGVVPPKTRPTPTSTAH